MSTIFISQPISIVGRKYHPNDFLPSLAVSQQQILNGIGVWVSEGSGWTISSIAEHYINTVDDI